MSERFVRKVSRITLDWSVQAQSVIDRELRHRQKAVRRLSCEHHTSYPYVFRHEGSVFLIPESGDAGSVTLFAAERFPHEWEPVATLVEGVNAVDATVHAHDGILWMWLTVGDETIDVPMWLPRSTMTRASSRPGTS